jgi:hypothetical protein
MMEPRFNIPARNQSVKLAPAGIHVRHSRPRLVLWNLFFSRRARNFAQQESGSSCTPPIRDRTVPGVTESNSCLGESDPRPGLPNFTPTQAVNIGQSCGMVFALRVASFRQLRVSGLLKSQNVMLRETKHLRISLRKIQGRFVALTA